MATIVVLISTSCTKEEVPDIEPEPQTEPWDVQISFGNSSINSKPIVTNQDGWSNNYFADYVNISELPNSDFEFYTIHVYIPSNTDKYTSGITSAKAEVHCTNAKSNLTGDLDFVKTEYLNMSGTEQQYAMFSLTVRDTERTANKNNFMNIVFSFNRVYKNKTTEAELYSEGYHIEIYKRT